MVLFQWDITEPLPADLPTRQQDSSGIYTVTVEDFDIAIGDLPFIISPSNDRPYERQTDQWRKDQFDTAREVGEQSLVGWWLRSQASFAGGSGITFIEPLLGEGSETRFRDSRGVNVFDETGEISLLHEYDNQVTLDSSGVNAVAGLTRVLVRDGASVKVWNGSTIQNVTFNAGPIVYLAYAPPPGTPPPAGTPLTVGRSMAYTGTSFLIGTDDAILILDAETGTAAQELWTGAPGAVEVYWAKERIFAAVGNALYELTLAGGTWPQDPLFAHPDENWRWTGITETGGAVWAAGFSGMRSNIHVITIADDGTIPNLTGSVVGVQLPHGERADTVLGYLDFLLIGTSKGLRVAAVNGAQAALGGRVFDAPVHSLAGLGRFVWCGLDAGLTRRVDLGNEIAGDLGFAWANDAETGGVGPVLALVHLGDQLMLIESASGLHAPTDSLVELGTLDTGFIRYGTLEPKHFRTMQVTADLTVGTIDLSVGTVDPLGGLTNLADFNGSRDVNLNLPGNGLAQHIGIRFGLNRDDNDPRQGPILQSYQLRALPVPKKRRELMQLPLLCFDDETDRQGNKTGGPNFAFARYKQLKAAETSGPVLLQDFRTRESLWVEIDQIHIANTVPPDKGEHNWGGYIALRVRTVD